MSKFTSILEIESFLSSFCWKKDDLNVDTDNNLKIIGLLDEDHDIQVYEYQVDILDLKVQELNNILNISVENYSKFVLSALITLMRDLSDKELNKIIKNKESIYRLEGVNEDEVIFEVHPLLLEYFSNDDYKTLLDLFKIMGETLVKLTIESKAMIDEYIEVIDKDNKRFEQYLNNVNSYTELLERAISSIENSATVKE